MLSRFFRSPWTFGVGAVVTAILDGLSWAGLGVFSGTPEQRLSQVALWSMLFILFATIGFVLMFKRILALEQSQTLAFTEATMLEPFARMARVSLKFMNKAPREIEWLGGRTVVFTRGREAGPPILNNETAAIANAIEADQPVCLTTEPFGVSSKELYYVVVGCSYRDTATRERHDKTFYFRWNDVVAYQEGSTKFEVSKALNHASRPEKQTMDAYLTHHGISLRP